MDYINLITPQHRMQPKYIAWLTASLTMFRGAQTTLTGIPTAYDIDLSIGAQLNALGVILGVSRTLDFQPSNSVSPVLDDTYYRLVLKAKVMTNQWDGTREQYDKMLETVLSGYPIVIVDNCNMSIGLAYILTTTDTLISDLLLNGYLFPVPSGVAVELIAPASGEWGNLYYRNFKWDDLVSYTWDELSAGI